jgi:hypothetical protein
MDTLPGMATWVVTAEYAGMPDEQSMVEADELLTALGGDGSIFRAPGGRFAVTLWVDGVDTSTQALLSVLQGPVLDKVVTRLGGNADVARQLAVYTEDDYTALAQAPTRLAAAGRLRLGTGLNLKALPPPVAASMSTEQILEQDRDR